MRINKADPILPPDYRPQEDEPYMSPVMLAYFRQKLLQWRQELKHEISQIQSSIREETERDPDHVDRGCIEEGRVTEFSLLEGESRITHDIEDALERIEQGNYGYSEESGEPIGIKRLEVWPIAFLTFEEEERREKEKTPKADYTF